jgi:hypothetical protein
MNPVTIRGKENRTNRDTGVVLQRLHIGIGSTTLKQVSVLIVDQPDVEPTNAEEVKQKIKSFVTLDERDFVTAVKEIFPDFNAFKT